jgi:hypothetical protein
MAMETGSISISDTPKLSVSVSNGKIVRGDSVYIYVSGGTAPYTFFSQNESLATITSDTYLLAKGVGKVAAIAKDVNNLSGESAQVEILGYRMFAKWPETETYQGDTIMLEIQTSTLEGLSVIAGSFNVTISNGDILQVVKEGTMLSQASVETKLEENSKLNIAFANNVALSGDAPLIKLKIGTKSNVNNVGAAFSLVKFNEDLEGAVLGGSLTLKEYSKPTISYVGGFPNPLLPEDSVQFSASGGQAPYTWSLTLPELGNMSTSGVLKVNRGGKFKVKVTDANGIEGISTEYIANDGKLEIATETAVFDSEHLLPVRITQMPTGRAISAYDMRINIDTSKITFVEVVKENALSKDFSIVVNSSDPRAIRVVGASSLSIKDGGDLFYFKIKLKSSFQTSSTNLSLSNVIFNEGLPNCFLVNGNVTPGDPPPVSSNSAITINEDEVYTFAPSDFGFSQSQGKPLASIKIISLPEDGFLKYGNSAVALNQIVPITNINQFTYNPPMDVSGDGLVSFEIKVGDADAFSNNVGIVVISVSAVNDAPRFTLDRDSVIVDEGFATTELVTIQAQSVLQEEGETYSYTLDPVSVSWANVVFNSNDLTVAITFNGDKYGKQKFYITADDGQSENNVAIDSFVLVVNKINEIPEILAQTFSIAENSANGTIVSSVVATDADNDTLSYSITSGNESGAFALSVSGELSVADGTKLDFETVSSYSLNVKVSDGSLTASSTITVDVTDVDENLAPEILAQTFSIAENSANGTNIGSVVATDAENGTLSYSITSGNESGAFALSVSGELSVADGTKLDFETISNYSLSVEVSDGSLTASSTITVNVTDVDESVNQAPQILPQTFSIVENSANGTNIGSIVATDVDNDALSYSITSGNESGAFALSVSGELSVADGSKLDFETISSYSLSVEVSDGSLTASATITVNVTDVDESVNQAPQILAQTFSIAENSANGTNIGSIVATDADNDALSFTIISGNESGAFALSSTGALSVADGTKLDFETVSSYSLNVEVSDGSLTASATITVDVTDVDENLAPEILPQTFSIAENSANGTNVGSVVATDADNDALSFTITSGNESGAFALSSTGGLSVADGFKLDFETVSNYSLSVEVSDGSLTASSTITVNVTDVDESVNQAPQLLAQTFSIAENSANGTNVGSVVATDADNDALSYSITSGNESGAFALSVSGELIVADGSKLDFETISNYSLSVEASDGSLTSSATITVNVTDVDESVNQAPQILDQTFSIAENSANGTVVGVIIASDNEPLTFSIISGNDNNVFLLSNGGILTVADQSKLDFEKTQQFSLTVEVSDGSLKSRALIKISLNDLQDPLAIQDIRELTLFPNPTKDFISVVSAQKIQTVRILDLAGVEIARMQANNNLIDIRSLSNGAFFVVIEIDKKQYFHRIVKQ